MGPVRRASGTRPGHSVRPAQQPAERKGGESVGNQEVSKPVMMGVVAVAVLVIGFIGWFYFGRPQTYPGFQAPPGKPNASAPGAPRMIPGQVPGTVQPQSGGPH